LTEKKRRENTITIMKSPSTIQVQQYPDVTIKQPVNGKSNHGPIFMPIELRASIGALRFTYQRQTSTELAIDPHPAKPIAVSTPQYKKNCQISVVVEVSKKDIPINPTLLAIIRFGPN